MRYLALLLVLLVPFSRISHAQLVSFEKIAGPTISKLGSEDGDYFLARRQAGGDTLLVWIQHATTEHRPNYEAARAADLVIWCHPDQWPIPNHVHPNATGEVATTRQNGRFWVIPESSVWWKRVIE